ncbi:TonB-dependent copper receptor [Geminisphaera colitermitum]|uniref:TonB-dependent copper receptor n=1 Tax=Geminisphaera colitermitum TaxID=1148786 RepID=UPI000196509E|nr:TonB-dependent copper receptor [Geminisphaera colitermitum]
MNSHFSPLIHKRLALLLMLPAATFADAPATQLEPLVITATPAGDRPLEVRIDPQTPAQPIPAQDGADILKTVPGISVSRKGGTGGEVILRGSAGSRLDILVDHESILGGCPNRMDPPTAYIFPGAYDSVTVLKGPQTVLYGPGNSAGVVLFEAGPVHLDQPTASLDASLVFGSFDRNDQLASVLAGTPDFYVRVEAVRSESHDYEDGNGDKVHSHYERSTERVALGWTPDKNTVIELHGALSQGEAAYAHSMMDAARLDRQNVGLRFEKRELTPLVESLEASFYYNHIDHVMDNYSLRTFTPTMMMPMPMSSNPEYTLWGGRALATLAPAENTRLDVGGDFRLGGHSKESVDDAQIDNYGFFAEATQTLATRHRLIAGLRLDTWRAEDKRTATASPTGGDDRNETLPAGFLRYEQDLSAIPVTVYVGIGYTQRAPDYWEMFSYQSAGSTSAFDTDPEKTTQLDIGATWKKGPLTAFVSGFANDVSDYILIEKTGSGMMAKTIARNIDARSLGGEAGFGYTFGGGWQLDASIAYVRGENRTDDLPLAQQPPLEGRIGISYTTPVWSLGALARLVDRQDRYAVNQGSVAGQDIGATGGFAVFSINGGWRINSHALLTAGIDNLFDKTYAEHVNRAGDGDPAYATNVRVNEPGRTLWMKLQVTF